METIEKIRAKRKTVRSASTKFVNKVKSYLETFDSQNETHQEQLSEYLLNLDAKQIELQTLNKEVEDLLLDKELFEAEIEGSLEYEENINEVRYKIKSKINKIHLSQPVVNSKGANESNHNSLFCPKTKTKTPLLNNSIEIPERDYVKKPEIETQVKEIVMSSVLNPSCSPEKYATLLQTAEVQVINGYNLVALHFKYDQARRRFVEWAQNEIAVVSDFHKRILFSDEAHFWLNGYVNKQNCRIWSEANPQVHVETLLHPEKLTVWCALWAGGILLQKR
ncbi:uncharacterized protein TNCV_2302581 [Trichonephila clavipes]|nr:uncharacterized protein TNCV_2302581 [Trichonephila clavipes]